MKCPNCNIALAMSERQGIPIDYCPDCRGVWLEKGKLEKFIENNHGGAEPSFTEHGKQKKKEKEGFLGEIFDF